MTFEQLKEKYASYINAGTRFIELDSLGEPGKIVVTHIEDMLAIAKNIGYHVIEQPEKEEFYGETKLRAICETIMERSALYEIIYDYDILGINKEAFYQFIKQNLTDEMKEALSSLQPVLIALLDLDRGIVWYESENENFYKEFFSQLEEMIENLMGIFLREQHNPSIKITDASGD